MNANNGNELTLRERFFRAMACKEVDRPPVCGMTTTANTDLMDHVGASYPEAQNDAALMAKLSLGAPDFFGYESCRVPYCLAYEAESLGCNVWYGKKDSTPMVKTHPYEDESKELVLPKPSEILGLARNQLIVDSIKMVKEAKGKEYPIILGITGPFTIAGHLAGTENVVTWILTDPERVHKITKFAADYATEWSKIVEKLGIDAVQMSEPSGTADMLNVEMFEEFVMPYVKQVFAPYENTKTSLHICGDSRILLDSMIKTGCNAISVEEKVPPEVAVEKVNGRVAMIGNVGVVRPLLQGTPDDVRKAALHCADAGMNIIAPGCGMSALIPTENMRAMTAAIKGINKKQ